MATAAVSMVAPNTRDALRLCTEQVRESFIPMELSSPKQNNGSFVSRFVSRSVGPLRLTEAEAASSFPYVGQLRRENIPDDMPDHFVLHIARSGRARHMQFGRLADTEPGKMILLDARAPYRLLPDLALSSVLVRIPGALLRSAVGVPEDYCGIPIDAEHGLNAVFSGFLLSMWRESDYLDEAEKYLLSGECLTLLTATLRTIGSRKQISHGQHCEDRHFEKAMRFITANLGDSSLGPRLVAKALNISDSRLHAIARGKGTTIGRTILDMRLERCHAALADPRCRHRGVTQIAFDWGFNNAAHFSQTFKEKYGVSPREHRKRHSDADGLGECDAGRRVQLHTPAV